MSVANPAPPQPCPSIRPSSHQRSQSNPYFHHRRTLTSNSGAYSLDRSDFSNSPISLPPPITTHVSARPPVKQPGTAQRHTRSQTTHTIPRLPLVTTDIRIESVPAAALSSSIFSANSPIKFDLSPPESPILSPEKDKWGFISSFRTASPETSPKLSRISTWFQGESAPISLGVPQSPTKVQPNPFDLDTMADNSADRFSRNSGFFSSLFTAKTTTTLPVVQETGDEFLTLDVKRALYPYGPGDAFSPAAYKNLQQNAEGLLARMQAAYRIRNSEINDFKAEQEAQEEELEEAQTRTIHLKSQLDTLSSRLDEQNHEMERLVQELQNERRLRHEEAERNRTIRIVQDDKPSGRNARSRESLGSISSTPGMVSDEESFTSSRPESLRSTGTPMISSTPFTPRVALWHKDPQYEMPTLHFRGEQQTVLGDDRLEQENTELKNRVGHLEKELDSCLQILNGIGL